MVIDDKYELSDFIGEGAMGWVYRGRHRSLDSTIAVKLMKPASEPDDSRDQRFAREARAASRLNNPHIISIIDFGRTPGGMLYIVSEYLRGTTLADLLLDEPALPINRTLQIMDQVLSAVDEAHGAGLVHRDLKPENIIITPMRSGEDFVKVLDFGIAKLGEPGSQRLTVQGQLFGTPAYMAPEQIRGQEVTARTDLYACALVLYEMLCGEEPFQSESVMEVLSMQLHNAPLPLRERSPEREIPRELEALVMRGLAKDPEERFATAAEMRQALHGAVRFRSQMLPAVGGVACSACGQPLAPGVKFCPDCGSRQGEPDSLSLGAAATMAGTTGSWPEALAVPPAAPAPAPVRSRREARAASPEVYSTLQRRLQREQTLRFDLVGRGAELRTLEAFFASEHRVAQLLGPLGSGRTRLLDAVAELARARGLRVARAGADPNLSRTPWYPVQRVAEQLLGIEHGKATLKDVQARALAAGLSAADVPGLAELFGHSPLGGQVEYAVRRRETLAAAIRLIRETPLGREGLCLLLDDVDDFDGASLGWLEALVEEAITDRIYVVITGEVRSLPETVPALNLQMRPLDEAAVEMLVATALENSGGSLPDLPRVLMECSAGNVFHVVQCLRMLAEGGSEADAPLGDVLTLRIGRLPRDALRVLQAVCVLGQQAPLALVDGLFHEPSVVEDGIRLLERRGFLTRPSATLVEVSHPNLVVAAREAMPADARRELHRKALGLLREQGANVILLARHALEAHAGEEALTLLRAAGKQAEQWLDDVGAAYYYQRAMQVARWELLYEESSEECLELSLHLGDVLRFTGDLKTASLVLKEAIAAAGDQPELHARLLRSLARVHLVNGEKDSGLDLMRDAVREAIFSGNPSLLNELYIDLGRMLLDAGRFEEAASELSEGVAMVTGGDGPDAERTPPTFWRLLAHLAEAQLQLAPAVQEALDPAVSALAQARQSGSLIGQARSHFLLAQVLARMERDGAADDHHASALAAFRRLGDRQSVAECLLVQAELHPEEGSRLGQEALELARQVRWRAGMQSAAQLLGRRS